MVMHGTEAIVMCTTDCETIHQEVSNIRLLPFKVLPIKLECGYFNTLQSTCAQLALHDKCYLCCAFLMLCMITILLFTLCGVNSMQCSC